MKKLKFCNLEFIQTKICNIKKSIKFWNKQGTQSYIGLHIMHIEIKQQVYTVKNFI